MLLDEVRGVGVGDIVDQVDLVGPQRGQPNAILLLGLADHAVEIGQRVALGVGLPEILEAHQLAGVEALPRLELEWPAAHRVRVGLVDRTRRHEVDGVVDEIGVEGRARALEVEAHRVLVVDRDALDVRQRRAGEGMTDLGIEDALDVPLDRLGVDGLAVVELGAATQLESPSLQVGRGVPFRRDGRDRIHLGIEVEQTTGQRGQRLRHEIDEVAMGIEADGIVAHTEAQRAAAFGVSLGRGRFARQRDHRGACQRRRSRKKFTPCAFGALFAFASHGRSLPVRVFLGPNLAMSGTAARFGSP